jgi:hypothetical protein
MRWVRRVILVVLTLVAAGAAWLWPRSYKAWDLIGVDMRGPRSVSIRSVSGKLEFRLRWGLPANDVHTRFAWLGHTPKPRPIAQDRPHRFGNIFEPDAADELELLKMRFDVVRDSEFLGTLAYKQSQDSKFWGIVLIAANNGEAGERQSKYVSLVMPHGYVVALAMAWPLLRLIAHARRVARVRRGLCGQCAYDVRSSTDACPECGTPIKRRATSDHGG